MSDRKAELERKKLRLQQIREEKKRKEEEKKKREVQFIFKISSLVKWFLEKVKSGPDSIEIFFKRSIHKFDNIFIASSVIFTFFGIDSFISFSMFALIFSDFTIKD